jgi:hypothetical protein
MVIPLKIICQDEVCARIPKHRLKLIKTSPSAKRLGSQYISRGVCWLMLLVRRRVQICKWLSPLPRSTPACPLFALVLLPIQQYSICMEASLRLLLDNVQAGSILGRSGQIINEFRKHTHAKICCSHVVRLASPHLTQCNFILSHHLCWQIPGCMERILTISGSWAEVSLALRIVVPKLLECVSVFVFIDVCCVGLICLLAIV